MILVDYLAPRKDYDDDEYDEGDDWDDDDEYDEGDDWDDDDEYDEDDDDGWYEDDYDED